MEHSSQGTAASLTDLMTSLMVVFILLLVATLNNKQQESVELRDKVREELQQALRLYAAGSLHVERDPKDPLGLVIVVPEDLLRFELNKADVREAGRVFVAGFAPILATTVCGARFRDNIASVIVEGHTDSSGTDEHNLRLSQDRSMAVVRVILEVLGVRGGAAVDTTQKCFLEQLSASGRGKSALLFDQDGMQEDSARSRRVIFKIRVRTAEERGLFQQLESAAPTQ